MWTTLDFMTDRELCNLRESMFLPGMPQDILKSPWHSVRLCQYGGEQQVMFFHASIIMVTEGSWIVSSPKFRPTQNLRMYLTWEKESFQMYLVKRRSHWVKMNPKSLWGQNTKTHTEGRRPCYDRGEIEVMQLQARDGKPPPKAGR